MRALVVLVGCAAALAGCATSSDEGGSDAAESGGGATISFFDSGGFDRKLSDILRADPPEASITFVTSPTVNDLPERLDKWLVAVEKYDGTVAMEPDPEMAQRSIIGEILSLVTGVYKISKYRHTYGPVGEYDATVYYLPSGSITRIRFHRKAG